ncbi:MAG TPA: CopD family protein [Polyangiaceae bacterium]
MIPDRLALPLVALHLTANLVWIGALLAVALLLGQARLTADGAELGRLARRVHVRLAVPAFLVSFLAGLARLLMQPSAYLHMHWMHAKLTLAVVVIVIHHILGAKAKRVARGDTDAETSTTGFAVAVLVCAAGIATLVVMKSALVP